MTFAEVESRARRKARADTTAAPQSIVFQKINDAITTFGRDVNGLPYREYPVLSESFDLETHFGFHIEISGSSNNDCDTDVAVTDADVSDQTGAQVATELQAQIRTAIGAGADLTVAWTDFYFTIDTIDGTSIDITGPDDEETYADYTAELFGSSLSADDSSVAGGFPQGCTRKITLDTECIHVNKITWNDKELYPVSRSAIVNSTGHGVPAYYDIRGRVLWLVPSPSSQGKLYIEYKGVPEQVENPGPTDDIPDIPEQYQNALVWFVAYDLLMDSFEDEIGMGRYAMYRKVINQYKADYSNQNTQVEGGETDTLWYTVRV